MNIFLFSGISIRLTGSVLCPAFILYEFVRIVVIRHPVKLNELSSAWLLNSLTGSLALPLLIPCTSTNCFFGVVPPRRREWIAVLLVSVLGFAPNRAVMKWRTGLKE